MNVVVSSSEALQLPKEETASNSSPPPQKYEHLLLAEEQKMVDIEKPHHHDVLCGRGVTTNKFPGNESFRSLVAVNKEVYVSSTKRQKMVISRSIVETVRTLDPPGRFLDKDPETGLWFDIGHKRAVEKTSQALRDGAATLKKQLSDDLDDPEFLNGLFKEDDGAQNGDEEGKQNRVEKEEDGSEKADDKEKKDAKVKASEKLTPAKTKTSTVKKGHRRVKSNPSILQNEIVKRHRRCVEEEPLESESTDYPPIYHNSYPPPHTPAPPPHARSLPNSPATWGGSSPYSPENPGSFGQYYRPPSSRSRHQPYSHSPHHPPGHSPYHHHSSPSGIPPYGKASNYGRYPPRSHPSEHHDGPPPPSPHTSEVSPHHHSWPPYRESRPPRHYQEPRYPSGPHRQAHYPHQAPPTPRQHPSTPPVQQVRSSTPPPPSPVPASGHQMPPVSHRVSSAEYYSKPSHMEWSPRNVDHYPYYSPRGHFTSPPQHHDEYPHYRPSGWSSSRSHSPYGYYDDYDHPDCHDRSDLTVPSLGGEGRDGPPRMELMSPKLNLARRAPSSTQSANGIQAPPRPPSYSRMEVKPAPPPSRFHSKPRDEYYRQSCSPVNEEKKTAEADDDGRGDHSMPYPSKADSRSNSEFAMQSKDRQCNGQGTIRLSGGGDEDKQQRIQANDGIEMDGDQKERRMTANRERNNFRLSLDGDNNKEEEGGDASMAHGDDEDENLGKVLRVDDIAMSPIPFELEDPSTIMELPENLLTMPISPCGPDDEPVIAV